MKTTIKYKAFLIFLILSVLMVTGFVSCNNFSGELNNPQISEEDNTVYINSDDNSENARGTLRVQIITPTERTATASMDLNYLSQISLTGERNGVVHAFGSWSNIMNVQGRSFSLAAGHWSLTLTGNYNGYTFLDTKNIIIESGQNQSISFELTSTSTTGGLEFRIFFPPDTDTLYTSYEIKKYPSNEAVSSGTGNLELQTLDNAKYVGYNRQGSSALASGTYRIVFRFYGDSARTALLNTYSEIIHIKGGFLTTCIRTIVLNELFTITYHYPSDAVMNEGDTLIENYSINSRYEDIVFPDLSKNGYDWHGWYTMENGNGDLVTALPLNSTGNKNYYAYFTPHPYTITYELYGGSHVISNPTSYTIEDDIILNPAEKADYEFVGWYTDTTWTTNVQRIGPYRTGNISLYAKWTPAGYPITYMTNGGTNSPANPASYTVEDNISFAAASKDYYTFAGWFTDENFASASQVTGYTAGSITGPIVIYAKWTPVQFPITYVLNGGSNSAANPTSFNIEENVTFADPSKTNYIFQGWYTDSAFTIPITGIIAGEQTEAITLYAKWQPNPSDVNITPDGFPGSYICNWTATGTSPNISISITIKDASGTNIITPDSFSVQVCINGEPSGYTFTSQSFTYPSAISGFAAPSNSSFYVTVTIGTYTYDFYAVSP